MGRGGTGPGQPQPRSIEELIATVSASRLSTWLQCHLKFHFRYVAGVPKPPTAALHVGKAIHALLQQWSLARWRGSPLDSDAIVAVFEQAWSNQEGPVPIMWEGEEEAASKANALAVVQTYLRETPIPLDEKPEGVEVAVEMDLASHGLPTLIGVMDLVRTGGRIVDFKTTGCTPDSGISRSTGFFTSSKPMSMTWNAVILSPRRASSVFPASSSRSVEHGSDPGRLRGRHFRRPLSEKISVGVRYLDLARNKGTIPQCLWNLLNYHLHLEF